MRDISAPRKSTPVNCIIHTDIKIIRILGKCIFIKFRDICKSFVCLFEYIYRNAKLARLNEENILNYINEVLRYIKQHKNITYTFEKILEINRDIIKRNINKYPDAVSDYFEGDNINNFIDTAVKSSILIIKKERPENRPLGITVDEQHLIINFITVYKIALSLSKIEYIGKENTNKNYIKSVKEKINKTPIII